MNIFQIYLGQLIRNFRIELILIAISFLIGIFSIILIIYYNHNNVSPDRNPLVHTDSQNSGDEIAVDIQGAVNKPDSYTLHAETRIKDVIALAGGLSPQADNEYVQKEINLSKKLSDEEKIFIPFKNTSSTAMNSDTPKSDSSKINLNQASAAQLQTLPGVGPATAQKIIDNRPYSIINEILIGKIVSQNVFEKIKDLISI